MLDDLIDKYAWVKRMEAWTVAAVEGRGADEVVRIYGGDPAGPVGDYTFAEADALDGHDPDNIQFFLQVRSHGRYVVAVEHDGYSGSLPEIARRCSAGGGQFFSVYWNINAFGLLTQAIDGTVTARFESLYPFSLAPQQPGDVRPAWAVGPEVDVELAWQACLALMEQQTGLSFDLGWLAERWPTYRIPDPHWLLRDVPSAEQL